MNLLKKIHRGLVPYDSDMGYAPYLSLAYLTIFFVNLYFAPVTGLKLAAVIIALIVFLICYFRAFWVDGVQLVICIVSIFAIGVAMAQINFGASVFFVYAAAMCSQLKTHRIALGSLIFVICSIGLFAAITQQSTFFWIPAILFSFIIGLMTVHQAEVDRKNKALKLSEEHIEALAKTAERERIGRDLHDVLGHSLSVITLKSELASKMIDKGVALDKIREEIKAVEELSRETLAQVRGAVVGYNQATIDAELLHAQVATKAADIELISDIEVNTLTSDVESQLALIVREAITNIVRHAETKKAWVTLHTRNTGVELSIKDQGSMTDYKENSGLNGMRQRITKLGGEMYIETAPTCLRFNVPVSV